jgi:hypothetical protein
MSTTKQLSEIVKSIERNVIPPMTHPYGAYWDQPPTSEIILDDTHALMTRRTFEQLPEYSASKPTGVYEGKMWRRHDGAFDQEFRARGGKPIWLLCWYGIDENPDFVSNNSRKIILVDGDLP